MSSIDAFLESLDIRDATLVGESIGAVIALTLAARGNPRVKRVLCLNPADTADAAGLKRSSLLGRVIFTAVEWPVVGWIVVHAQMRWLLREILRGGLYDNRALSDQLLDALYAVERTPGFRAAELSTLRNLDRWQHLRDGYGRIEVPVTLVYGTDDWTREVEREANRRDIPNVDSVVLQRAGHFSALDAPDRIVDLVMSRYA